MRVIQIKGAGVTLTPRIDYDTPVVQNGHIVLISLGKAGVQGGVCLCKRLVKPYPFGEIGVHPKAQHPLVLQAYHGEGVLSVQINVGVTGDQFLQRAIVGVQRVDCILVTAQVGIHIQCAVIIKGGGSDALRGKALDTGYLSPGCIGSIAIPKRLTEFFSIAAECCARNAVFVEKPLLDLAWIVGCQQCLAPAQGVEPVHIFCGLISIVRDGQHFIFAVGDALQKAGLSAGYQTARLAVFVGWRQFFGLGSVPVDREQAASALLGQTLFGVVDGEYKALATDPLVRPHIHRAEVGHTGHLAGLQISNRDIEAAVDFLSRGKELAVWRKRDGLELWLAGKVFYRNQGFCRDAALCGCACTIGGCQQYKM